MCHHACHMCCHACSHVVMRVVTCPPPTAPSPRALTWATARHPEARSLLGRGPGFQCWGLRGVTGHMHVPVYVGEWRPACFYVFLCHVHMSCVCAQGYEECAGDANTHTCDTHTHVSRHACVTVFPCEHMRVNRPSPARVMHTRTHTPPTNACASSHMLARVSANTCTCTARPSQPWVYTARTRLAHTSFGDACVTHPTKPCVVTHVRV